VKATDNIAGLYPGAGAIAARLVDARHARTALDGFPGPLPAGMDQAYATQEAAIELWPDAIAGWKIGRVPPALAPQVGTDRLAGPIFASLVTHAAPQTRTPLRVIDGGFAAVEAEVVWRLGQDAPADRLHWTAEDALRLVAALHIGVEFAASPMAQINALGPAVVASDFGNNGGLVLGPEIPGGVTRDPASLVCETFINGTSVGASSAASLLEGPVGSLVFLLEHCAARGRPLKAGCLVSTGQITGIHDIVPGDSIRVAFGEFGDIHCEAVAHQT
jgi:2-keto-4-pentenoate hydratase